MAMAMRSPLFRTTTWFASRDPPLSDQPIQTPSTLAKPFLKNIYSPRVGDSSRRYCCASRLLEQVLRGHLRGKFPVPRSRDTATTTAFTLSTRSRSGVSQPHQPAVGSKLRLRGGGGGFPPFKPAVEGGGGGEEGDGGRALDPHRRA